jgi:hypothetical protein
LVEYKEIKEKNIDKGRKVMTVDFIFAGSGGG